MFKNYKQSMKLIKKQQHKNLLRQQRGHAGDQYVIGDDLDLSVDPNLQKGKWAEPINQALIFKLEGSVEMLSPRNQDSKDKMSEYIGDPSAH